MQIITINAKYKVLSGPCENLEGKAVCFDSTDDELWIQVDPFTSVVTHSDNVEPVS